MEGPQGAQGGYQGRDQLLLRKERRALEPRQAPNLLVSLIPNLRSTTD